MYTNALLLPVRGTKTFDAPANSFCCLLWNWSQADVLGRSVATDLAVPIGHEACLAEYLDQLTLVATEENDAADTDRSPCMSRMPNPFRLPLFPTNHRLAADTRFFCAGRVLPLEWSTEFLRAPRTFVLSGWHSPIQDWELTTDLWVATPVVVSYLAHSFRHQYSSAWQMVYSEYYCNQIAAWVRTLQKDKICVRLDEKTLRPSCFLDTSKLRNTPDSDAAYALYRKMRRALKVFSWGAVLKDVVRRDTETGDGRHVRVTVDETREHGFFLRHTRLWNLTEPRTPMRRPMYLRSRGITLRWGAAVGKPTRKGPMPLAATMAVTTVRGRPVVIARDRCRRRAQSKPLGRRARLSPRRLPCLGQRAFTTRTFARPVKLLCRLWRMPG